MKKLDTLLDLGPAASAIESRGGTAVYVYGSRARGDHRPDSDLDVFVDYDPEKRFSLLDLVAIKHLIEDIVSLDVHITTRDSLHPALRSVNEHESIRVL